MTVREQKSAKIKSYVDWASYAVLGGIGTAILAKMSTALDLLNAHTVLLASFSTWAKIIGEKLSMPFN